MLTDNYDVIMNLSLDSPLGTRGDHCIIKFDANIITDHQPSVSSLNIIHFSSNDHMGATRKHAHFEIWLPFWRRERHFHFGQHEIQII